MVFLSNKMPAERARKAGPTVSPTLRREEWDAGAGLDVFWYNRYYHRLRKDGTLTNFRQRWKT